MTLYVGLNSGTSMDAVDAVLVDLSERLPRIVAYHETPYTEDVRATLLAARKLGAVLPLRECMRLDVELGRLFAQAALQVVAEGRARARDIRAIGSHGQTIWHNPDGDAPSTLQIGDPNVIAARTGIQTVTDFRRMDVALGGQGAPLAPAFHKACFHDATADRAIVNIGGIANLTVIPAAQSLPVTGHDTGPGNCLLDDWAMTHLGQPCDRDGSWAAAGRPLQPLLAVLLADPYFSRPPPKSTGREYFNLDWLRRHLDDVRAPAVDVQATLRELTAASIANAVLAARPAVVDVFVCGGGAYNGGLMRALAARLPGKRVETTAAAGLPPDRVEAVMFAWLACCRIEGRCGNLPAVTGARQSAVLGGIYLPPAPDGGEAIRR
jgi:anhydro-N-acetylmuramic acid kinase